VVQPRHDKATLGTMLGELKASSAKFMLAIPGRTGTGDIAPLIGMMQMLWDGQSSRHGSQTPTRPETLPEAQMAVHLAVTLVMWFCSGAVRPTGPRCNRVSTPLHQGAVESNGRITLTYRLTRRASRQS
jgi:hypothetical protein